MTTTPPAYLAHALQIVVFASAAIVLTLAEPAINRMSPCTPFIARLAFHLLAVGAFGNLLWVALGDTPNWPESVIIAGIALMLVCDRLRPRKAGDRRSRHQASRRV
jgi:hypothetical protein